MRKTARILSIVIALLGTAHFVEADDQAVRDIVRDYFKEKSKLSGTFDFYDARSHAVRNLRTITFHDEVKKEDGLSIVEVDYRDIKSGDVVTVAVRVEEKEGRLSVKSADIKNIAGKEAAPVKTDYTDPELHDFMAKYLRQQVQFTEGVLALFDEERGKMRNLELIALKDEVRRLGVLAISRADFKDKDNGDTLGIDVTVENKKGTLTIQSLRIRDVKRAPSK